MDRAAHTARAAALAVAFVLALALACTRTLPRTAFADEDTSTPPPTIPLLVVAVGFSGGDDPATAVPYRSDYDWNDYIFGQDGVAAYYTAMSDGAFTFTPAPETSAFGVDGNANEPDRRNDGVVHVTLPAPHGSWAMVNEDTAITRDFCTSAMSALQLAEPYVDFASFDADGDGTLAEDELTIVFCIAGYEASAVSDYQTSELPLIWAHSGFLNVVGTNESSMDGLRFGPYVAMAEQYWVEGTSLDTAQQQPLGLPCHELAHALTLPDLYAIDDGTGDETWASYAVGDLSLMATGLWASAPDESESSPYPPISLDAWSRYELGWTSPTVVRETGDYTVSSQLSANGYSQLLVPTADPTRYYLIENRQPEGYDESLGQAYEDGATRGGIVIWLVDEELCEELNLPNTVNSTSHHPGVMQLCYEVTPDGQAYSQDYATSQPVTDQPFYDSVSWTTRYGDTAVALELPTYGADGTADLPSSRELSGASVSFPTESARDMTVHIVLSDDLRDRIAQQHFADSVYTFFGLEPRPL